MESKTSSIHSKSIPAIDSPKKDIVGIVFEEIVTGTRSDLEEDCVNEDGGSQVSKEGLVKVPKFGAWEGEVGQYTEYLEKTKNRRSGLNLAELQKSRDVGSGPAVASQERQGIPYFANVWKTIKNMWRGLKLRERQMLRDVGHAPTPTSKKDKEDQRQPLRKQIFSLEKVLEWLDDKINLHSPHVVYGSPLRRPSLGSVNEDAHGGLRNYGRAPLISANFGDYTRHQPSVNDDAYGGGNRTMYDQGVNEAIDQKGNLNQVYAAFTPQNPLPTIHTPDQKPTKEKRSLFSCFRG